MNADLRGFLLACHAAPPKDGMEIESFRKLTRIALADEITGAPLGYRLMLQELAHRAHIDHNAKVYADDDEHCAVVGQPL
jgi:hypothetical protein